MGQKINTRRPDKSISGASIMKESIAGRKTQFVLDTTVARVAVTAGAGSTQWVTVGVDLWATDLPTISQNATNIIPASQSIIFPQADAYVDNDNVGAYYLGSGSSLSSGQLGVTLESFVSTSPAIYSGSAHDSGQMNYFVHNYDSSSHVVYLYLSAKYIVFADVNL